MRKQTHNIHTTLSQIILNFDSLLFGFTLVLGFVGTLGVVDLLQGFVVVGLLVQEVLEHLLCTLLLPVVAFGALGFKCVGKDV